MRIFGLVGLIVMLGVVMFILMRGVESFQQESMGEEGTMDSYLDSAKDAANSLSR